MTNRRPWGSSARQAALFSGVLVLAWIWDAVASGHLEEQAVRVVLGCSVLAGVFVWMKRSG